MRINNYANPLGGPPECRWVNNNCGPNDEPFSWHTGGCQAVMGDGSVRFVTNTVDLLTWQLVGARNDGVPVTNF